MVEITLNNEECSVESFEELGIFLDRVAACSPCELWLTADDGQRICMLQQEEFAWLMYLDHSLDSSYTSIGDLHATGKAPFTLSNGQVDEYPIAFCIDREDALKAISFFWVNHGMRPSWINWRATI